MSIVCSLSGVLALRIGDVQWKEGWRWDVELCSGLCSKVWATLLSAASCTGTEPPGVWIISPVCSRAINSAYPTRMKCQPGLSLTDAFVWLGRLRGWLCVWVYVWGWGSGCKLFLSVTPLLLCKYGHVKCKRVCRNLSLERNPTFWFVLNTVMFSFLVMICLCLSNLTTRS